MKEINLQIPEGHEIDLEKSSLETGKIIFKKKETKLPTTNEECVPFLPDICCYINDNGDIDDTHVGRDDKSTITSKEYAEAFLALMQLVKFRDIWNDGWKPDWADNSGKYVIYFYEEKKSRNGDGHLGSRVLSFKTSEIRDKFSKTFDELIHKAKPLL